MILHIGIKNDHVGEISVISEKIKELAPDNRGLEIKGNMITLDCGSEIGFAEIRADVEKVPGVYFVRPESVWPAEAHDPGVVSKGYNSWVGDSVDQYGIYESP